MKRSINFISIFAITVIGTLLSAIVSAQAPQAIPYQAVARDASGKILGNSGNIVVRFTIKDATSDLCRETHTVTTNALGLFSVNIGQGLVEFGNFSTINWGTAARFLKVEMDATGSGVYTDMGTTQLMSVPYALYAEKTTPGSVVYMGTWNASTNSPPLSGSTGTKGFYYVVTTSGSTNLNGIDAWQTGDWAIYNGTGWEKVDNTGSVSDGADLAFAPNGDITSTNVQDAIVEVRDDTDAKLSGKANTVSGNANNFPKLNGSGQLVDSGLSPGDFLDKGNTVSYSPTSDYHPATKKYVDDADASLINSYIHRTDDNVTIYLAPGTTEKRFGIGNTAPECPLGIKATGTTEGLISFHDANQNAKWFFNLNPSGLGNPGFNMDQMVGTGNVSRLFIQESDGYVGIGTVTPSQKLHIEESVSAGITGLQIRNTATAANNGFVLGHRQSTVLEQDGAFSIYEQTASGAERFTIRSGGNVGINETLPYAKLHVSRDPLDPQSEVHLAENTGILALGPIDDKNLVMDAHQVQARTGEYIGSTLSFTATLLGLQPYGGGVIINANSSLGSEKVIITSDARLGLGTITPAEKVDIDGAIKIGTTVSNNAGTIRWSGSDFEGYDGSAWKSFTLSNWAGTLTLSGAPAITYNPSSPKVGIGIANPSAALDIHESSSVTGESTAMILTNSSSTSSSSNNRVGLKISINGFWGFSQASKNIGLYIPEVTGQSNSNANLAAVLNGNVVIGDVTASPMIGTNGKNVLGFQNGDIPTQAIGGAGVSNGGIQLYSAPNALGTSVFNVMTGDGHIIQLFRSPAITAPDNSSVGSSYGTTEQQLIINMRDRINALEAKLQAFGLLD